MDTEIICEFANGNLSYNIDLKGYIGGALKTLQYNLNHLTWQAQMIASGDFSQRVDFMGEFFLAFNSMVESLEKKIQQLKEREGELSKANIKLKLLASLDGLTQLANRRMFDDYLLREWRLQARNKCPLSLIICDIDYFKRYNDSYGHQAGDECLKKVATVLKDVAKRPTDLSARYGGEEFVIILPNTNGEGATRVAQRIKSKIRGLKIEHARSDVDNQLTLSMGLATTIPNEKHSAESLIKKADKALYEAKKNGRNNYLLYEFEI